jgi:DNA-binding NtrC family response regulator
MKQEGKILIVDDDEDVLLAASMLLRKQYTHVHTLKDPEKLTALLRRERFDVILLDMNFTHDINSGREGFFWLRNIKVLAPETIVVLFTAFGDVEMAVRSIKEGAFDFVLKPWQNEKLLATMSAAFQLLGSKEEVSQLRSREKELVQTLNAHPVEFIGQSAAMRKVFSNIAKVAATDANVLITGENGTGKELVARELHRLSNRSQKAFIAVDMGALSEHLFESELFGHVKGAFTDAREDRPGRFEVANGGSIFLDEIGNLPLMLQPKLLAVLQNRQVTRVGSNKVVPIDVRLICATNLDLHQQVQEQQFRQDVLYRINTVEIALPALRERSDDIPLLATYYLDLYARKYQKKIRPLGKETLKMLMEQHWPGNVRELQHTIERAIILCEGDALLPSDVVSSSPVSAEVVLKEKMNLDELEKATVLRALNKHNGVISQAATELGLSRAALYRRMEKYGI